ncbi:MAG TPA: tRNA (guanosine(37)-N1)-methyltransferase TrmD [Fibrobacteres bacterium]|jgi:tRNA (guanine37-N1)-methyltransferase|nr:tRNA (guanosine(37)-N1)-methyltransferase TrmD [Fibrobacterota bacterium]
MRVDVITLFPEMFEALNASIPGRAQKSGALELRTHQLRDHAINKHGQVDDAPYGGEAGMVLRPEPLKAALDKVLAELKPTRPKVILMSAQGRILSQNRLQELSETENLLIICGHYKGVDQRFCDAYVDEEISMGDYVVSGGELPAMVLIDAVARLLPDVLHDSDSAETDSFQRPGRLGWPVYTRPQEFEGRIVPEVLVSGHHENIQTWRLLESLRLTGKNRPELLEKFEVTDEEQQALRRVRKERKED